MWRITDYIVSILRTPSNFRFDDRGIDLGMTMLYVKGCRKWCHYCPSNLTLASSRNPHNSHSPPVSYGRVERLPGHTMRDLLGLRTSPALKKVGWPIQNLRSGSIAGGEWDRRCESGDGARRETHVVRRWLNAKGGELRYPIQKNRKL